MAPEALERQVTLLNVSLETLYQRLLTEAETWPLASEAAFGARTLHIGREGASTLDAETSALARELERHLRQRAGGMSLGSLERLRDGAWFGESVPQPGPVRVPLARYVVDLGTRSLERRTEHVGLRLGGTLTQPIALERWRWLTLRIPADLLISALAAESSDDPSDDFVNLQPDELRDVMKREIAETHLHATAGFSFATLWTAWARWFGGDQTPRLKLDGADEVPFKSTETFIQMLLVAFLARWLLALFLDRRASASSTNLDVFLGAPLDALCAQLRSESPLEVANISRGALRAWMPPQPGQNSALPLAEDLRRAYAALIGPAAVATSQLAGLVRADPLFTVLSSGSRSLPETRFATRSLRYLLNEGGNDTSFSCLFWQYQRVRNLAFRFLVEESGTAGLDWFQRFFARLAPLQGPLEKARYDTVFESVRRGLALRSMELRLHPKSSFTNLSAELKRVVAAAENWTVKEAERPEFGLVYHFLKERHPKGQPDQPHGDPAFGQGLRFGAWYRDRSMEASSLEQLLARYPASLLLFRGVDVASSELAVPTWVTVGLVHRLRKASLKAAREHRRRWPEMGLKPIRVTYHVGEEYQRLTEGLRRIHELIEFRVIRGRDRIGHALALGANVETWIREAPLAFQPVEDRLDDLLWEWDRYQRGELMPPQGRLSRIEELIRRYARELYQVEPPIRELSLTRQMRHFPARLDAMGFNNERRLPSPPEGASLLLWQYLTDRNVYARGQRLVKVLAGDDNEQVFLENAQRWLQKKIQALSITVEINPTSNLLIANLQGMQRHPVVDLAELNSSQLRFSINSDDPLTFATTLADEYAYLYGALERRSTSAQAADRIEQFRQNGWSSRFTLKASTSLQHLRKCLSVTAPLREQ